MTKVTPKLRLGSKHGPQNKNIIVSIQDFPIFLNPSLDEFYPDGRGNESHSFSTIVTNSFKISLDLTIG
jgi:hypothetical protein